MRNSSSVSVSSINQFSKTKILVSASMLISLSIVFKYTTEIYIAPDLRFSLAQVPVIISGMLLGPIWGAGVGIVTDLLNYIVKPGGMFYPGFTFTSAMTGFIPGLIYYFLKRNPKNKLNFNILNIGSFVILILGLKGILIYKGIFKLTEGVLFYNSQQIMWWKIILFLIIFIIYMIFLFILNCRNRKNGLYSMDKIIFTVTLSGVVCTVLLNTLFLMELYGSSFIVMLPFRIVKLFFTIPLYAIAVFTICEIINKSNFFKG